MFNASARLFDKLIDHNYISRYENKFILPLRAIPDFEIKLKTHIAVFREIYQLRTINNIYLDTPDFSFYRDNINGSSKRLKARIRWYGNLEGFAQSPFLEFKLKNGALGNKLRFGIKSFNFDSSFDINLYRNMIDKNLHLPNIIREYLKSLTPTIINSYTRKYFMNNIENFRITYDSMVKFYKYLFKPYIYSNDNCKLDYSIVELKYDKVHQSDANNITEFLGLRISKMSKYSTGVDYLYDIIS